ncbi:MAG: DUF167 domain-containing protein [Candidatus Pacebacteria bacterium]|nr:DUF167 domain-containing protein [Candidatus Paceibacterota bacterium]
MYIKIKAHTGVSRESIVQKDESTFLISVKEKPQNNNANKRILQLIADWYQVPVSSIRIISGHHHSSKIFSIQRL